MTTGRQQQHMDDEQQQQQPSIECIARVCMNESVLQLKTPAQLVDDNDERVGGSLVSVDGWGLGLNVFVIGTETCTIYTIK
jgi:hypothetical protein